MKTISLFRALLHLVERPQYEVATETLQISTASLSRHADGLLRRPSVMRRAAEWISSQLSDNSVCCDADLLTVQITADDLVMLARHLRNQTLREKKK